MADRSINLARMTLRVDDFHARVLSLSPKVAVFDCDGTLWAGDAGSAFMRWTIETQLIAPDQIAWINERYEGYKRGDVSELAICGEMVQVYRGLSIKTLRLAASAFFRDHVEHNIFPEMAGLVAALQRDGCEIWAVSSTNDWVIEEGARHFNIPANRVLAARVATADGCATEILIDVPTDDGKVKALRRAGVTHPDAVFGNSVHDAAMLAIARGAFPVNPSADLVRRSEIERWPLFFPASVLS